ncbi:MAG TPA: AAA family ATPase, partial [Geomonas sp.]
APTLIITCGLMGSGKSALARELAFELGLTLERSDLVRKELAGRPPTGREAEGYQQGIYRAESTEATYQALLQRAGAALAAGRSVIVDATFRLASHRDAFRAVAERLGAPFFVLETRCDQGVIRERLEGRRLEPGEVSDGRWELFPSQLAEFEAPQPGQAISVDSSLPLAEEVDLALRGMGILP